MRLVGSYHYATFKFPNMHAVKVSQKPNTWISNNCHLQCNDSKYRGLNITTYLYHFTLLTPVGQHNVSCKRKYPLCVNQSTRNKSILCSPVSLISSLERTQHRINGRILHRYTTSAVCRDYDDCKIVCDSSTPRDGLWIKRQFDALWKNWIPSYIPILELGQMEHKTKQSFLTIITIDIQIPLNSITTIFILATICFPIKNYAKLKACQRW